MATPVGTKGLELVKEFEGCYLTAYKDIVGVWTIGYGHTGKVDGKSISKGMTISQAKADSLLKSDLQAHANYVDNKSFCPVTEKLNEYQRDALISFCYNVGPGNLKKLCTNHTISEIGNHITDYDHAGGKVVAGLTRRRKAEQKLFKTEVPPKYNFSTKKYQGYDKKCFREDLQIALKCTTKNGTYTDELLKKTITLSTSKNKEHVIVRFVQKHLKNLGYYEGEITKVFDANTKKAVKKFQKGFMDTPDGIMDAGETTWKKLIK